MDKLKIEYVPIDSIKLYENNAKLHPKEQIEQIKKSMQEFGNIDPIGVWHNEIVEGHGRYLAAKALQLETVPVIRLDDLTDEQRKAYALVHNKLTMNSDFDADLLDFELNDILDIDMEQFGFNISEDEKKEKEEKPEVEFSEILGEENNYIVLQFKTGIDWLNAQSLFGLETVKSYSTRKDGKVAKNMEMRGIPRIVDGAKALNKLMGDVL